MEFRSTHKNEEKSPPGAQPVIQRKLSVGKIDDPLEREADSVADQVMQMPEPSIQRKCQECEEEEAVQRKEISPFIQHHEGGGGETSQAVSDQVESSKGNGESLSAGTKSFMESRFNTDFTDVRIHQGSAATELSNELNAQAFTVGKDIYFNSGKYAPETSEGQHLLAHELTHTLQQEKGIHPKLIQRACFEEGAPEINMPSCAETVDIGRQAQGTANALDSTAQGIISLASGSGSNQDRAMQLIARMICRYLPTQASRVRKIKYHAGRRGLETQRVGSGASAQGDICVGDDFLTHTDSAGISRRLLQLGHELDHIGQYRRGLEGESNQDLREFLAFYNEGLADEFIGTGRMSHATRKALIDAAIGYYYCLSSALQTEHAGKLTDLLTRRATVNGTRGNDPTPAPTTCRRQG